MSFMDDLIEAANGLLRHAGTNAHEAGAIVLNATSLPKLLAARKEALRWSRNVSYAFTAEMDEEEAEETASASRNAGPADALRHCYLSAMLGRDLGYEDALLVLTTHEMNAEWGSPASRMDLFNNAIGIEIGVRSKTASDGDLQEATMNAFLQGRLRVVDKANGNVLVPTKSLTFGR
ncbi:hypothetical protein GXW74_18630 [Roseomonas eburnea]|uniref:DUF6973 domain-containing protein n=1 Tax=Neoroseomonas eburnea TaxID=1346889 RepID=A0A9X9XFM8_9PROT|nr:hypothetical protein [Neoroseomonas eburnea]MBR0682514.1 hypothetical protein [Neoroseomonas eburnea]